MKIRFWGVRGSLPAPLRSEDIEQKIYRAILGLPPINTSDPEAVRSYVRGLPLLVRGTAGGNTPCVEVRSGGETLIIDAGSGLRELGLELLQGPCGRGEGRLHILLSHLHWDHIQGFPSFRPAFVPGNRLIFYGVHEVEEILERQQLAPTWPVTLSYMRADKEFVRLEEGVPFSIADLQINTIRNTHPNEAYSFRLEDAHGVLVYASDIEFKELDQGSLEPYLDFFRDADALIFDTQYTLRQVWQEKFDWGHSSAMIGVDMARAAGVKRLLLFHHDPTCSDADLQEIRARALAYQSQDSTRPTCEVLVAYEGMELDLVSKDALDMRIAPDGETAILTPVHLLDEHGVDRLTHEFERLAGQTIGSVIDLSEVEILTVSGLKALVNLRQQREGAPIVLVAPSERIRRITDLAGYLDYFAIYPSVQAALDAIQTREALNLPGQMLKNRYQIEGKVGDGPLGTVLQATDTWTGRTVALKILSPSFNQESIERLLHRSERIVDLNHPYIVRVYAWEQEQELRFKVEEFVEGLTLEELFVERDSPLPVNEAMSIALDVADALEYAHRHGVVHGNLKPSNIFLTEKGARLSGFGLGEIVQGQNLIESPLLLLPADTLAPEQVLGQPIDARTDLYALGTMLYQLFTGQPPFKGSKQEVLQAHLYASPQPPRELNGLLSRSQEHLILKLLAKNPNERYASAQQARRIFGSLASDGEDIAEKHRRPLVGREKQIQALRACWETASAGRGQLAFITGESGIGKTSLAQRVALYSQAPVQLMGHCQERQGSPAYSLFSQVLQAYFATVPPEFSDQDARQLLGNIAPLVPELNQMLPDLPRPAALDPEQEQLRLMSSLTRLVELATRERPWLIILDDLQWADPSSLELLRYLGHHLPSMALMLLGTYREAELGSEHPLQETLRSLRRYPTYRHFPLGRLNESQVGTVLGNLWGQMVPADLADKIHRHTGGNPFYVEEVAQVLVDEGLILAQGEPLPTIEEICLPPNVHEAILQRIGLLSMDAQELLCQAAVLGQTFAFDELRELSALSEWQVLELLDMALERKLIQEVPGDTLFRFHHKEIQHVLYSDLSPLRRRKLHRQAGEALERLSRSSPERIAEELAHHWSEAGEFERAVIHSMVAARQAQAAYANEAALMWYRRALDMLGQINVDSPLPVQELCLEIHQSLGAVLSLMGRNSEALGHCKAAWAMLQAPPQSADKARAWADLCRQTAFIYFTQSEYELALEWLERGMRYLDENEPSAELARIHIVSGLVLVRRGDLVTAQGQLERALDIARCLRLRLVQADSLRYLAFPAWHLGEYDRARAYLEQALPLYRELSSRQGESAVLNNLGVLSDTMGDPDMAKTYYEQALPIYREVGDLWGEGMLLTNMGVIDKLAGHYVSALMDYERALSLYRQVGDRRGLALVLDNLGSLFLHQGDDAQARVYLEQALSIKREIGNVGEQSETLAYLGLLYHHLGHSGRGREYCQQACQVAQDCGDRPHLAQSLIFLGHNELSLQQWTAAQEAYQRALELRYELHQPGLVLEPLAGLAEVALSQEKLQQAQGYVQTIMDYLEQHNLPGVEEPLRIYHTCYRVLQAMQDPRSEGLLEQAYQLLQERAANIDDAERRQSFLQVKFRREIAEAFEAKSS
ncbi:MAG: tetratricopeptide repeat protein [Chloroflexia bacterium]|nr:tetratricopeptide repeat protein [Chloroflexia bacterium]